MSPVDGAVLAVMGLALLRGTWIGMIREVCSIAALLGACVAVRLFTEPFYERMLAGLLPELGELGGKLVSGLIVGLGTALLIGVIGRLLARGVRAAGLGPADRFAGAMIGATEGALVVGIGFFAAITVAGDEHPLLAESRTLAVLQELEQAASGQSLALPPVASPPRQP
jgi:membrane protein required for colicin V production